MRLTHADKPSIMRSAMREQFRLEQSLQITRDRLRSGVLGADEDEEILYAEHVTRGYRVDVQDVDSGEWRSLCRRAVSYRAGNWSWPATATTLEDEGVIEPTAFADPRRPEPQSRARPKTCSNGTAGAWSCPAPIAPTAIASNRQPTAGHRSRSAWQCRPEVSSLSASGAAIGFGCETWILPATASRSRRPTRCRRNSRSRWSPIRCAVCGWRARSRRSSFGPSHAVPARRATLSCCATLNPASTARMNSGCT